MSDYKDTKNISYFKHILKKKHIFVTKNVLFVR